MFFLDYEDASPGEGGNELWEKYLKFKDGDSVYIDEEEAIAIIEDLDDKDMWDEAFVFIEQIEKFYPHSAAIIIKKADILISLDKTIEAKETLDRLMNYDTNDVDYFLLRTEIDIILSGDTEKVRIWIKKASLVLSADDYAEFIHDLIEMLDTYNLSDLAFDCILLLLQVYDNWNDSTVNDLILLLPLFAEKTDNAAGAIRLARAILEKIPHSVSAWITLSIAYISQKKYNEAVEAIMFALAIDPHHIELLPRLAYCYSRLKKLDSTINVWLDYLEHKPDDVQSLRQVGACYLKKKHYALATYYLEKALSYAPANHEILADIAQIHLDKKDYYAALQILNKTLELTSDVSFYHGLIAHCLFELGSYNMAIKYFSLALTSNLKKKDYWEGLLKVLAYVKDFEQLYEISLQALKHTHKQYFLYYLAYAEFKLGKSEVAIHTLQRAIAASPRKYAKISIFLPLGQIKSGLSEQKNS